jgi:predicted site-specific integrase-resolvase
MPVQINDVVYYQTAEACRLAGTSRNTFLRWVKQGTLIDVVNRDRRGWRLFTEDDLKALKAEANRINKIGISRK